MADETPVLEPKTDNHETEEHPEKTPIVSAEAVETVESAEATNAETAEPTDAVATVDAFFTEPQGDVHEAEVELEVDAEVEVKAAAEPVAEAENDTEHDEEHTEEHAEEAPMETTDRDEHDSLLARAEPELEEEEHDEHSTLDHSEADHYLQASADSYPERPRSALGHHEEESHYDYEEHEEHGEHDHHEMSVHQSEEDHGDYVVEDEYDVHEANEETVSAHNRLQQALADADTTPTAEDARRSSTSSSRSGGSGGSDRRTSMRTEALIQAAARAVVAKINGVEAEGAEFNIPSSATESPQVPSEGRQSDSHSESRSVRLGAHSSAATHSTSNEEVDYEHEGEMGDDDDVFSNPSHRTSLGSFEHHSGASITGSDYDHHKKDIAMQSMAADADAHDSETRHEEDYEAETGSVSYHEEHRSHSPRISAVSTTSKGPRISDVTGISRISQYDRHHRDDDESYHDNDDYTPHTIRGAPRPAFRTPSSVRAMQMSSPSPSAMFGVSPRSAARRRRVGTGDGDEGQSMGSVATYSSMPNSPSKRNTPTRFKVFQRPEPAPLVLLHATIMPTRWGWSDVLRNFDKMTSHSRSNRISENKDVGSHVDSVPTDLSSFEPSAALKRLHNTWCQLQEYSFGADTVTERGVLLPHPQNDYEVLEERLLEALELPVRRRARILECGHYLGPADDDDDDEDYDYYDDENNNDDDEDSSNKRHWCTTCRSEIRYESLGAERVFRVKVYASNGLMTVGAWDACWREMERVDVEIEPIVADPALQRELNLLRNLQQQEVYRREIELEEEMRTMQQEKKEEEQHDDITLEAGEEHLDQQPEHVEHLDTEHVATRGSVDQSHHASPSPAPVSPPLRDSPVEPPATTSTDRAHDHEADYRRRAAEDRLREIYGSTPPHASPSTMSLPPQMEATPSMSATPGTALAMTHHSMHTQQPAYGPLPSSPSAEAYERREERRYHQYSYPGPGQGDRADRGFEYGGPAPAFPPQPASHHGNYNHGHPQQPYEAASFLELLMAAMRVFLRDRKHVAITVLSVIVIVLATLRTPATNADATTVGSIINIPAPANAVVQQPIAEAYKPIPVAITTATVFHTVVEELAASVVAKADTQVETVVEKMTVKVYETVTEVATETSTETATTTATEAATTATVQTVVAEPVEPTLVEEAEDIPEATEAVSATEPQETIEAIEDVVAEAEQTSTAYEVVSVEEPQQTVEPEASSSSVAAELPMESADIEPVPFDEEKVHDDAHDEL